MFQNESDNFVLRDSERFQRRFGGRRGHARFARPRRVKRADFAFCHVRLSCEINGVQSRDARMTETQVGIANPAVIDLVRGRPESGDVLHGNERIAPMDGRRRAAPRIAGEI